MLVDEGIFGPVYDADLEAAPRLRPLPKPRLPLDAGFSLEGILFCASCRAAVVGSPEGYLSCDCSPRWLPSLALETAESAALDAVAARIDDAAFREEVANLTNESSADRRFKVSPEQVRTIFRSRIRSLRVGGGSRARRELYTLFLERLEISPDGVGSPAYRAAEAMA